MALAAATLWEVRTGGNDANGSGFNPNRGGGGVDRSQQDAAHVIIDGVAITAVVQATTTDLAITGYAVSAADLGNIVLITGGTMTAGAYEIVSIPAAGQWRLDRSGGAAGQTGTGRMGGASASPAFPLSVAAINNKVWVKAGTYLITSTTFNVAGGCVQLNSRQMEGYSVSRGDQAARPLLQASGINTATMVNMPGNTSTIVCMEIDAASLVAMRGIAFTTRCAIINCLVRNCTNSGIFSTNMTGSIVYGNGVTGCGTAGAAYNCTGGTSLAFGSCVAWANTVSGFSLDCGSDVTDCLSYSNTGATTDGFDGPAGMSYINCTAYGNGRDGFNNSTNSADVRWINCLAEGNVRNGFNRGSGSADIVQIRCGAFSNGTNFANVTPAINFGNFTATFSFFTNAAGGDFSLNNNVNGGALARQTGYLSPLPNGQVTPKDLGAVQVAVSSSGGGGGSAIIGPGAPGWVL